MGLSQGKPVLYRPNIPALAPKKWWFIFMLVLACWPLARTDTPQKPLAAIWLSLTG